MLSFSSRKPLADDEPFVPASYLWITAGTFQKLPFLEPIARKQMLLESLDFNAYKWQWRVLAWVLLDNHYHLVVQTPPGDPSRLAHVIQSAHSFVAYHMRKDDPSIRTRIWWNFWDTPIPDAATLRRFIVYVHDNPALHGLADQPGGYEFSSFRAYHSADAGLLDRWRSEYPPDQLEVIDSF